ncbi:MAG TPA: hypothetical protein VNT56_06945 [Acidimicrobiales bacterium]|nr:hypothetical protein [Acidimicrobiales bacterium]
MAVTTAGAHAGELPLRSLSMAGSSFGLIAGKFAAMALGFLFWLVAARHFDAASVGLAAAAVSAMMLCVQFAHLGAGSAFVSEFPTHRARPARLLDTTFSLGAAAAIAAAGIFLAVAATSLADLGPVLATPAFATLFVAVTVLGTLGVLLDQVSMALRRGDHVAVRNTLGGTATLVSLVVLVLVADDAGPLALFALWLAGTGVIVVAGMSQVRRSARPYRYRLRLHRPSADRLVGIGLPNYALTLSDRAPGLVLPLVVTELLSAGANAYWYTAWMMAWAAYVVPVSVGTALFAEVCQARHDLAAATRRALRSSLRLGIAAAVILGLGAEVVLAPLGPDYAAAGAGPLRLLLLAIVPLAFVQTWFAVCRACHRLGEAVGTAMLGGTVVVAATAVAGAGGGLEAMAATWSATQLLLGLWCWARLRRTIRDGAGPVPAPVWAGR